MVLHLVLAWTALLAFRGVAESLFAPGPAWLATVALATHLFFVIAVGRNYVDGFGIAYFLLALLAVSRPRPDRRRGGFVAAGVWSVAAVGSNLFYVVLLPWLFGHARAVRRAPEERIRVREVGAFAGGGALCLLVLGAISAAWGGHWFLLESSVQFVRDFTSRPSMFVNPPSAWLPGATWLAIPLALVVMR